jgi:uridine kinase
MLFSELATRLNATQARLGGVRLIAVDGPSGSGKSRFAARLGESLSAPIVHTDDLLDGWDDQFTFWPRLEEQVLDPLRHGRTASYLRYQWDRGYFGGNPVLVPPAATVVLEGVTSARAAIRPELSFSVFVDAPAALRWQRALIRDAGGGDVAYQQYLRRWQAAEQEHFAAEATAEHAGLLVDGSVEDLGDGFALLERRAATDPRSAV